MWLIPIGFLLCSTLNAQENDKSARFTLAEQASIHARSIDYQSAIYLADSLRLAYIKQPFYLELSQQDLVSSGSSYVMQLYKHSRELATDKTYCDSMIVQLKWEIDEEGRKESQRHYQKLIDTAEESYTNGDINRAIQLYERAVGFKPSDKSAKVRLKQLKKERRKR